MEWTHTETISAPSEIVWRLATDVEDWPAFMPTIQSVERLDDGPLHVGARARIKQPAQSAAVWTVTDLTAGVTFTWTSQRRGFAMTAVHRVEDEGPGSRSTLTLTMTGALAPLLGRLLGPTMRRVLRTENGCFKARAEQQAAVSPSQP